jgi:hypothetical protein
MCTVLLPPGGYPIAVNKYIINWYFRTNCCLHRHVRSTLIVGPVGSFQTLVPNNQNMWRHNGADRHLHWDFSCKFLAASLVAYYVRLPVQIYYVRLPVQKYYVRLPVQKYYVRLPVQKYYVRLPVQKYYVRLLVQKYYVRLPVQKYYVRLPLQKYYVSLPVQKYYVRLPLQKYYVRIPVQKYYVRLPVQKYYVRLPVQKYRFAAFLWDKLRKQKCINKRNSVFSVWQKPFHL